MKRISFLLVLLLVLSLFSPLAVVAADVEKGYSPETKEKITAQAIYLKNLDTGDVIYEKNADAIMYPASTTKIMTAILALENTDDIYKEMVTYPIEVQNYLYEYQLEHGAVSTGQLNAGEKMPMVDFLYAAMLPSANEAAMTIAQHVGGSQAAFAAMMNQKAKDLGANNTNFVNPTGLFDKEHVTTARDMAIITEYALSLDHFPEIVSTPYYTTKSVNTNQEHTWDSTIDMQKEEEPLYYPGLSGVKTGTLPESGRCFISTAEKNGYHYLLVVLGSELDKDDAGNITYDNRAFAETKMLYDWVFDSFRTKTIVDQGMVVGEIPVELSWDNDSVQVVTDTYFSTLIPDNIDITSDSTQLEQVLSVPKTLDAPLKKGDPAGHLIIKLSGEEIGRVPVSLASNVEASTLLTTGRWLKNMIRSFWFKFVLIYIVLIVLAYLTLLRIRNRNKRKMEGRNRRQKPPRY